MLYFKVFFVSLSFFLLSYSIVLSSAGTRWSLLNQAHSWELWSGGSASRVSWGVWKPGGYPNKSKFFVKNYFFQRVSQSGISLKMWLFSVASCFCPIFLLWGPLCVSPWLISVHTMSWFRITRRPIFWILSYILSNIGQCQEGPFLLPMWRKSTFQASRGRHRSTAFCHWWKYFCFREFLPSWTSAISIRKTDTD